MSPKKLTEAEVRAEFAKIEAKRVAQKARGQRAGPRRGCGRAMGGSALIPRAPQRRASLEEEPGKAGAHHGPSNRREKQMEKITFAMTDPDPKTHSVKFAVSPIE